MMMKDKKRKSGEGAQGPETGDVLLGGISSHWAWRGPRRLGIVGLHPTPATRRLLGWD